MLYNFINMSGGELDPTTCSEYQRSAQQLLALLERDPASIGYYRVEWDQADQTRITNIVTMTASPTGALRGQEGSGLFRTVQFRITETDSSGDISQRFVWCDTDPRRTHTPTDPEVLGFQEHNYIPATPDTIVEDLTTRTSSVDDLTTLTTLMRQYGVQPVPSYTAAVQKALFQFIYGLRDPGGGLFRAELTRDSIFRLMQAYQELGSEVPKAAQGYLVTQLLRAIAVRTPSPGRTDTEIPNHAAAVLEAALRQGILPDEPRITNRVFATKAIYAYPFATDLLYDRLQADPNYGSAQSIFGVQRTVFAREYIRTILEVINPQLRPEIQRIMNESYRRDPAEASPAHLYDMLNGVARSVIISSGVPEKFVASNGVRTFTDVSEVLGWILFAAKGRHVAESAANEKHVAIVKSVLAPLTHRRIGRQATTTVEKS